MQLWGGRFAKETDALVRAFNDSIGFDQRMWREDIDGSIAWAWGLSAAGVIDSAESETIVGGLHDVAAEWENGTLSFSVVTPFSKLMACTLPSR